jgi:hypothetical protein
VTEPKLSRSLLETRPSRRTVLIAAAWAAPAVMALSAAPAYAASDGGDATCVAPTSPYWSAWTVSVDDEAIEKPEGAIGGTGGSSVEGPALDVPNWVPRADESTEPASGFVSAWQPGSGSTTVLMTYTYDVVAGVPYNVGTYLVAAGSGCNAQMVDIMVHSGGESAGPLRYFSGTDLPDGTGAIDYDANHKFKWFNAGTTVLTVSAVFTFADPVIPDAGYGGFWIAEPEVTCAY